MILIRGPRLLLCGPYYTVTIVLYDYHLQLLYNHYTPVPASKLNDYEIQRVQSAKYLGLTISGNLSWSTHISGITGQANSALSFFRRNFGQCTQTIKTKCYQTYIRPICEYAAVIWSPHLQTNIHQLEMIQKKAARFVFNYSQHSSVTAMLNKLDWKSLEKQRDDSILVMFHKIINQYVDIPYDHIKS